MSSHTFLFWYPRPCPQLLSKIRWGQCSPEVLAELRGRSISASSASARAVPSSQGQGVVGGLDDGIENTQLLTHKADVLRVNEEVSPSSQHSLPVCRFRRLSVCLRLIQWTT